MVDQSELAWRMLSRKYGAQICYTPMLHSLIFSKDKKYRSENFTTCPEDRPLITQFCGNDPDVVLAAARFVEDKCDAVDLNLGCPQGIAKKGHYGSFLQDEWELVEKIVSNLHQNLSIPVTCKIRIFPDVNKTIQYAQMLERAGCQLLTVHGRLREQKGAETGLADWEQIKAVKENVKIPVFSNGNILSYGDIERCLKETGVDGVMTAEGYLYNPTIFDRNAKNIPVWKVSQEYLDICKQFPPTVYMIKAHFFKMFIKSLAKHVDLRELLVKARSLEEITNVHTSMTERLKKEAEEYESSEPNPYSDPDNVPHWVCQVYVRNDRLKKTKESQNKKRPVGEPQELIEREGDCCGQTEKKAKLDS